MLCTLSPELLLLAVCVLFLFLFFFLEYPDSKLISVWCLQRDRFLKTGWENADALDMMTVYSMLPQDDVGR